MKTKIIYDRNMRTYNIIFQMTIVLMYSTIAHLFIYLQTTHFDSFTSI